MIVSVLPFERNRINHDRPIADVTNCKVTIVYKGFVEQPFMVNGGDIGSREDRGCRMEGLLPL